jgi:hypothetical protein
MANQQSVPLYNIIIKRMRARAVWKKKESKPLGHCAAPDPKRTLWYKNY